MKFSPAALVAFLFLAASLIAGEGQVDPPLPDGSRDAVAKISTLRVPKGIKVELFAAEPQLASPVALCLDEKNRVYVAEEFRFNRGTEENRSRPFLLDDDLQLKTTDDRLAMFRKFENKFDGGMEWFSRYTDQVRRLEDRDGDGRADVSTVFATGFNGPLDGLAAGVIARDGDIYLTCIPKLWKLRDEDGDGVAEKREGLLHGFGVNAAFLGHDLHGLVWGPDGKLYFSVGDRGFHVQTKEGTTLAQPRRGAVFRCNADGSELEVVHIGLRNPQELAFDEFGNLFADDNNCDKGDHARLVYVLEGADSGWNMAYQTMPQPYETGPWHAERIWHLDGDPQTEKIKPAWVLPPIGKLGAGPSGFAYCGAVGWSDDPGTPGNNLRGRFFHCNYTGNGGIESIKLKPKGAAFEIEKYEDFLKPLSITDCDFGYDGKLYLSDFVGLDWSGKTRGGRVYTAFDPERVASAEVKAVKDLFAAGFQQRSSDELLKLLAHVDMRVRQRAQFELANRELSLTPELPVIAAKHDSLLARLHAIWALGMIGRKDSSALVPVMKLLSDDHPEVRTQAARTLGDVKHKAAGKELLQLVERESAALENPRTLLHAIIALGRIKADAQPQLVALLRKTNDKFLRHACVYALGEAADKKAILALEQDKDAAVRLAAVLVLRRWNDVDVARFLADSDLQVVTEAARAVNDLPMNEAALRPLAALTEPLLSSKEEIPEALLRRVIHAHFRAGGSSNAAAVARIAAHEKFSLAVRREALLALSDWTTPSQRDRVTGSWRPLAPRNPTEARAETSLPLVTILASSNAELQVLATNVIAKLEVKVDDETFLAWARDSREPPLRIAALELLAARKNAQTRELLTAAFGDKNPLLRTAAIRLLAAHYPEQATEAITQVLSNSPTLGDKQQALASLAQVKNAAADDLLLQWTGRLARGTVPAELQLDVLEAARSRDSAEFKQLLEPFEKRLAEGDALSPFRIALAGGDAERGRLVFTGHRQAQCSRCHRVGETGGDAGPNLTRLSATAERPHLLASLILPNLQIAPGYGSVTLQMNDGTSVAGQIKFEKDGVIELLTPQGSTLKLKAADVEERSQPTSAMPPMDKVLTLREIRDVVEYLSTLK
ncbi:PVC-type heme-binding CxxCH protein [Anatilimnocola floriformis]|uniref:PVC-type heme-binding CxxCH protein n=1 Tax=Anatilimnocola floriformis TaxID=2948575 RepID=UPI0020C42CFE|nr:PVC-type heme-binding CxxCH protein [Anatilimnocola floriformis]